MYVNFTVQQALRDAVPAGYHRNLAAFNLDLIPQRSLLPGSTSGDAR